MGKAFLLFKTYVTHTENYLKYMRLFLLSLFYLSSFLE